MESPTEVREVCRYYCHLHKLKPTFSSNANTFPQRVILAEPDIKYQSNIVLRYPIKVIIALQHSRHEPGSQIYLINLSNTETI